MDVDVKDDDKHYHRQSEAMHAMLEVVDYVNMPDPSAIMDSGYGLHFYWLSDRVLTPEEWQPYALGLKHALLAHGLKCDAGLTADAARILRPPNTFDYKNYKDGIIKPVKLRWLAKTDYNFATDLAMLPNFAPPAPTIMARTSPFPGQSPDPIFAGMPMESLSEGIKHEALPVELSPGDGARVRLATASAQGRR